MIGWRGKTFMNYYGKPIHGGEWEGEREAEVAHVLWKEADLKK